MSKLSKRFIQLDPNNPEAITSQNIYFNVDKTIYEKILEMEFGMISIVEIDGGGAEG